jgi:glyoxylase-like metal-dependent hydrolase (beta-lactamase superfamily II)
VKLARQIDVETLRQWLDPQRPVTVLDIRTDEDRGQWAIPASTHLNAYEALRAERGFDARSLAGGMKAWSLAWNVADVPLPDASVRVIQVRRTGKGCLLYMVGSGSEAAVIDPSVSPDAYADIATMHRWSIRYVLHTHVHADHLSRARELSRQTGATLLLPPRDRVKFIYRAIADRERVLVGNAVLSAIHTPGHTDESTSYLLNQTAVFTGDTLFTNGVGRPDLLATRRLRGNVPARCSRRSRGWAPLTPASWCCRHTQASRSHSMDGPSRRTWATWRGGCPDGSRRRRGSSNASPAICRRRRRTSSASLI